MGDTNRRRAAEQRRRTHDRAGRPDEIDLVAEVRYAVNRVAVSHSPQAAAEAEVDRLLRAVLPLPSGALARAVGDVLRGLLDEAGRGGWPPDDLRELVRRRVGPAYVTILAPSGVDHPLASWLRVAAQLTLLPLLVDPPPVRETGGQEHPKLAQVRALLAKAESTEYDEEAEALTAKAQELVSRYCLEALLERGPAYDDPGLATRRLWLDPPYIGPKAHLVAAVAQVNRCRTALTESLGYCLLVGRTSDLTVVDLLVTSLLVQAESALLRHGRQLDRSGRSRTRSFRRSFLLAYAIRVGERLREAEHTTRVDVDPRGDLLPALREQDRLVADAFAAMVPHLRQRTASVTNREGWHAGRAAAEQARLGMPHEVGGRPRAIGPGPSS